MFQKLFQSVALGALRHFLTGAGASLVTQGYITADDNNKAVGAVVFLVGLAWSAYQKYQVHKAQNAAVAPPAPAPTPVNDTTGATDKIIPVETRPLDPIQ